MAAPLMVTKWAGCTGAIGGSTAALGKVKVNVLHTGVRQSIRYEGKEGKEGEQGSLTHPGVEKGERERGRRCLSPVSPDRCEPIRKIMNMAVTRRKSKANAEAEARVTEVARNEPTDISPEHTYIPALGANSPFSNDHGMGSPKKTVAYHFWRFILVIVMPTLLCCTLYDFNPLPPIISLVSKYLVKPHVYTKEELWSMNQEDRPVLAILGTIYDVSSGGKHYKKPSQYAAFTGRDASRAFVTGLYDDDNLHDRLDGLSPEDCIALDKWSKFYRTNDDYKQLGLVEGNFWDGKGAKTQAMLDFEGCLRQGVEDAQLVKEFISEFPTCSSSWSKGKGGEVACKSSYKGGGKTLVPRMAPKGHKMHGRCACYTVEHALRHPDLVQYPGCSPESTVCALPATQSSGE